MQKFSRLLCLGLATVLCAMPLAAADSDADVVRLSDASRFDYRPGQVIVKFKDSSGATLGHKSGVRGFRSAGVTAVDRTLAALGVTEVENLMPLTGTAPLRRSMPAFNGRPVEAHDMGKAYLLTLSADVAEAVSKLAALPDVEFAEPNYTVHALETEVPDDPFYNQQWGLQEINMYSLWGEEVLSKEGPVIAIIDTGVDIMHPDLQQNIWTNPREAAGASGYDDDANGYADDVHGWDFVNNTGVLADYNGHGTHCAGIAAATGYNGMGIIGANPFARIMPITAMQSNGSGDVGTIIKAVDYAAANGADVISMSLGTYGESLALEQALGRAYQKSIIVAAAGNDGYCLNHAHPEKGQLAPMPMFPAAYNFVLGVQAASTNNALAGFSNYDDDGATYSAYDETKLYNYEITAPGVSIISTYPNGNYRRLNGTSMATPLVAGAVSRLLMSKSVENKEEFFGDLINACKGGILDIYAAYKTSDADRRPELQLVTVKVDDSEGDADGRIDAGETVRFYPMLRNSWGNARNIRYSVEVAEEANTICEIATKEADFGLNLSSYAKAEAVNPIEIKMKPNVADGRICRFRLTATCDGMAEPLVQEFELTAENGVELTGILTSDRTLHADTHYIVTGNFAVPEGVTLTIEPGTVIKFKNETSFKVEGTIIANGEPGKMITFTAADGLYLPRVLELNFGKNEIRYCIIENMYVFCSAFTNAKKLTDCIIRGTEDGGNLIIQTNFPYHRVNFYNISSSCLSERYAYIGNEKENCNFINLAATNSYAAYYALSSQSFKRCNAFNNNFDDKNFSLGYYSETIEKFTPVQPNYLGTSREDFARKSIVDINWHASGSFGEYDLSNMLTQPSAEAHGIVWKVVVDGFDAQDEFDLLPPLGVGRHKVEVYFNRPMDKSVAPIVAMGVRPPYTQTAIGEDAAWNADGDIYTAYVTINGRQNIDGLNRIYVAGAQDDEFFEIPLENQRFNVNVQAAGSLSTGFFGESGVGCVKLKWEDMDVNFDDILGYNIYRHTADGDTVRVNERLIEPDVTDYTDYDVRTGNTYLYNYTVMTTALKENEPSKTVAVTPLTASMGDANGDADVNVLDILATVHYIGGQEVKPFLVDAADMNADGDINILDVVGIAHTILGAPAAAASQAVPSPACWWIEDGKLYLRSSEAIGGIQVSVKADRASTAITPAALASMETMGQWSSDNDYVYLAFSVSGASLPAGEYAVLDIDGDFDIDRIVLSDASATPREILVEAAPDHSGVDNVIAEGTEAAAEGIYNIMGVKVGNSAADLDRLPAGVYIVDGEKTVKR